MYCLCVNGYYCHHLPTQLQLTKISYHIISYHIISYHIIYIISNHIISVLAKALRPALTAQQAVLPGVEGLFINFYVDLVLNMHEVKLPHSHLLQQ